MRILLRWALVLALFVTTHSDSLFKLTAQSQHRGLGSEVNDVDAALRRLISARHGPGQAVLYLDAMSSFYSRRAFPVLKAFAEHLDLGEADKVPVYVLNQEDWAPESTVFHTWWTAQNATLPVFGFTKYRAILLLLENGRVTRALQNFVVGEGGPGCVAAIALRAFGRTGHPLVRDPDVGSYCDAVANHSAREQAGVWMGSSLAGWRPKRVPWMFPAFGVDDHCIWAWSHVPPSEDTSSDGATCRGALQGELTAEAPVVAASGMMEEAGGEASEAAAGAVGEAGAATGAAAAVGKAAAGATGSPPDCCSRLPFWIHQLLQPPVELVRDWANAHEGGAGASVEDVVRRHLQRAAAVGAATLRRGRPHGDANACWELSLGHPTYACECAQTWWRALARDPEDFARLFEPQCDCGAYTAAGTDLDRPPEASEAVPVTVLLVLGCTCAALWTGNVVRRQVFGS